jgi:hypothetical protein
MTATNALTGKIPQTIPIRFSDFTCRPEQVIAALHERI